jgi:hypothetical protein
VQVTSLENPAITSIEQDMCIDKSTLGTLPANVELGFGSGSDASYSYHEIRGLSFQTMDSVLPDLAPSFSGLTSLLMGTPSNVTLTVSNLITSVNLGDSADGQVDVTLPAGVALDGGVGGAPAGCSASDSTHFSCPLSAIPAGGNTQVVFPVIVAGPANVTNADIKAVVSGVTDEANTGNNTADLLVSTPGSPDLASTVTGPSSLPVGSSGTYNVTVTNVGNLPSDDGTVTITLPAAVAVDTSSLPANCTASGAVLTCTLAGIAQGGSVTVPVKVTAPSAFTNQPFTVQVTGVTGELATAMGNNDSQMKLSAGVASAGAAKAIPTLSEMALALLALLLCASVVAINRRKL